MRKSQNLPRLTRGLCPDCIRKLELAQERLAEGNQWANQFSYSVYWCGIKCYPTEWSIIKALVARYPDGPALSLGLLATAVYGPTARDMRHAIGQRIYILRKKMEEAGDRCPYRIETIGKGYRIAGTDPALEAGVNISEGEIVHE